MSYRQNLNTMHVFGRNLNNMNSQTAAPAVSIGLQTHSRAPQPPQRDYRSGAKFDTFYVVNC